MVWNTIAHPKMYELDPIPPGPGTGSFSPIKFADTHKLSFYDIIVCVTGTSDHSQLILVKGDFETIKKMLLNDEAVCGSIFTSLHNDYIASQSIAEINGFDFDSVLNAITLNPPAGDPMYLLSDNTISEIQPIIPGGGTAVPVVPHK